MLGSYRDESLYGMPTPDDEQQGQRQESHAIQNKAKTPFRIKKLLDNLVSDEMHQKVDMQE
jgi:hypothetical protein